MSRTIRTKDGREISGLKCQFTDNGKGEIVRRELFGSTRIPKQSITADERRSTIVESAVVGGLLLYALFKD